GIRDRNVTGVQTCALPILISRSSIDRAKVMVSLSFTVPRPQLIGLFLVGYKMTSILSTCGFIDSGSFILPRFDSVIVFARSPIWLNPNFINGYLIKTGTPLIHRLF